MSDDEVISDTVPILIHLTAGCIAGAVASTATWPLEYIKTQIQLQRPSTKSALASLDENADGVVVDEVADQEEGETGDASQPYVYTGMVSGIIYTVRTHGFLALYTGLLPTLLGSIPKTGIRFGLFAWLTNLMRDSDGNLSLFNLLLAGIVVGVVQALVVIVPVETVKTKCIQLKMSFLEGLLEILRLEGINGIYDGVLATVLRQSSNQALRFFWYIEFKRIVSHDGLYPLTPLQSLIGGMTSGMFSTIGNQPFDVLKTRMQGIRSEYSSILECVYEIFWEEGLAGFYKGIIPRMARVAPGEGIIFMAYEIIIGILVAFQQS